MSEHSAIEWTDATWNPVTGCTKVSPGCAHCYIEHTPPFRIAGRKFVKGHIPLILHPERLEQPLHWRKPRMVFVNSLSDLFHEDIPDSYIDRVFDVMEEAHRHTFQVLTKRPERMREFVAKRRESRGSWGDADVEQNVWLGVTIENRRHVDRADILRETPAAVRFISAEPLLGPLIERMTHGRHCFCSACAAQDWAEPWLAPCGMHGPSCPPRYAPYRSLDLTDIDWLIVGGESGPKHRPIRAEWVRALRDACEAAHDLVCCDPQLRYGTTCCRRPDDLGPRTAFFFKQWGGRTSKAGGRELDGRTWDELPHAGGHSLTTAVPAGQLALGAAE